MLFFFFHATATTEIYTLSLHDALPISLRMTVLLSLLIQFCIVSRMTSWPTRMTMTILQRRRSALSTHWCMGPGPWVPRSEEHTSELQSHVNLVCRLLLEKKNMKNQNIN